MFFCTDGRIYVDFAIFSCQKEDKKLFVLIVILRNIIVIDRSKCLYPLKYNNQIITFS